MPKAPFDPVESPGWSRVLAGPVDLWGNKPTLELLAHAGAASITAQTSAQLLDFKKSLLGTELEPGFPGIHRELPIITGVSREDVSAPGSLEVS
ncbi:hypothetical protein HGM15179_014338 [Zosterops borbonicus]|uniref:Uncharacterized protein n=1 Tax=Zosterops borbonicus TaxID=364589 RepID=A0A8K1LGA7_9PASS|nr:hypothetical protein HGM15179_014338 [Zosterops borbonicus]